VKSKEKPCKARRCLEKSIKTQMVLAVVTADWALEGWSHEYLITFDEKVLQEIKSILIYKLKQHTLKVIYGKRQKTLLCIFF
jgi:hypothetical protein